MLQDALAFAALGAGGGLPMTTTPGLNAALSFGAERLRAQGATTVGALQADLPAPADGWPRVRVESVDADVANVLHGHWLRREPVVVELAIE